MKKLYLSLICLCAAVSIIAFKTFSHHEKKHKKKHRASQIVSMRLPADLPFQKLYGQDRQQMIELIQSFPLASYQLFSVPKSGYFYLDGIDDLIKSFLKRGEVWEGHIQNLIHQYGRPGSVVLDIGAHIATHTLTMAQAVGSEGQVLAFEPQPKIFRELFLNMAVNQVHNTSFYWAGVGDHEGSIELGPLHASNEAGSGLYGGTKQFVPLLTIDSLRLSNVSLMKIDVEGMEDQVLDGAKNTILSNHPIIIIEIMGGSDFGTASPEVRQKILHTIGKLEQMGYQVSQLWRHDWIAIPTNKT